MTKLSISRKNLITAGFNHVQNQPDLVPSCYTKWKIKMNHEKSSHLTFNLKRGIVSPVILNSHNIPKSTSTRYYGLTLHQRLTWADHIKNKPIFLNSRWKSFCYLLFKHSIVQHKNKTLLISIWT